SSCFIIILSHVSHLFFFFQAEDGIRDSSVTGVQTCALPISGGEAERALKDLSGRLERGQDHEEHGKEHEQAVGDQERLDRERRRSEERRVGKEWRSGGSGGW